jgi:hypothetical protein
MPTQIKNFEIRMFRETMMKFEPSTELPMPIRVTLELLSVVLTRRERDKVGTVLTDKDGRVLSWQHCHNKHMEV